METSEWNTRDKLTFIVEWFDSVSSMTRRFNLFWYPIDDTLEMYDLKRQRLFLRRLKVKGIALNDLYVGNSIILYSRQMKVVAFGNEFTKKTMGVTMQKTLAIIKPDGVKDKVKIFQMLIDNGLKISRLKMFNMQLEQVEEMFEEIKGDKQMESQVGIFTSGPVVALELVAPEGVEALKVLAGPEDPEKARSEAPHSIRALYGTDATDNAIYVAPTLEAALQGIKAVFKQAVVEKVTPMSTAVLENSTCCIVKPHAVRAGHLANIMALIEEEGFQITALEMFYLDHINAGEFLEVYNGILPEFPALVDELLTGGCVAMEICQPALKEETPVEFRKLCGPADPDVARQLRPTTIRAKFGVDKVRNAVHVTDLPEDGVLEVEYFFRIMQL